MKKQIKDMMALRLGEESMQKLREFAEKKDWSISKAVRNIIKDYLTSEKVETGKIK